MQSNILSTYFVHLFFAKHSTQKLEETSETPAAYVRAKADISYHLYIGILIQSRSANKRSVKDVRKGPAQTTNPFVLISRTFSPNKFFFHAQTCTTKLTLRTLQDVVDMDEPRARHTEDTFQPRRKRRSCVHSLARPCPCCFVVAAPELGDDPAGKRDAAPCSRTESRQEKQEAPEPYSHTHSNCTLHYETSQTPKTSVPSKQSSNPL